jgi:hypothetical protein
MPDPLIRFRENAGVERVETAAVAAASERRARSPPPP